MQNPARPKPSQNLSDLLPHIPIRASNLLRSEIAKPRVRKPRVFINCHPAPPPKPPIPPPKTCHCRSLHSTMHSYTFPQGREGFLGSWRGFWGGGKGGVAIYENPAFPVSKPGVSQSQVRLKSQIFFLCVVGRPCITILARISTKSFLEQFLL